MAVTIENARRRRRADVRPDRRRPSSRRIRPVLRRSRRPAASPAPRRRIRKLRLAVFFLVLCILGLTSFTAGVLTAVRGEAASCDPTRRHPQVNGMILAGDGHTELAVLRGRENRTIVPDDEIAPIMKNAIVDIEDRRFYEHGGVDLRGMVRAFWADVTSGKTRPGRLDDHAAVHQGRVRLEPAHDRAQAPRGAARAAADAALVEAADPHRVPEHDLLRERRLRHPAGGASPTSATARRS